MLKPAVVARVTECEDSVFQDIYRPYCIEFVSMEFKLVVPYSLGRVIHGGDELLLEYNTGDVTSGFLDFRRVVRGFIKGIDGVFVPLLPLWEKTFSLRRRNTFGKSVYEYKVRVREAWSKQDYEDVLFLEQFHYADKEALLGLWRCLNCGKTYRSASSLCPYCGTSNSVLEKINFKSRLHRILIAERVGGEEWEPRVLGFILLTPSFPNFVLNVTRGVYLSRVADVIEDWLHPIAEYGISARKTPALKKYYGFTLMNKRTLQAVVRNMRVVVHPDYRSEGLGKLLLQAGEDFIRERRAPDNRRKKHLFFSFAKMARFNPFHERAGFIYIGDSGEGDITTPILVKPLTREGEERLRVILELTQDKIGEKLYVDHTPRVEGARVSIRNASVVYSVEVKPPASEGAQYVLENYGVVWDRKEIEKVVFTGLDLDVEPGEIVVVMGASGSGKTSILKTIYYTVKGERFTALKTGEVDVKAERAVANIPFVEEPDFSWDKTVIDNMIEASGGRREFAVKLLNMMGIGDVPLLLSKPSQISTGQLERFKIALLLARVPDLILIDEFTAFLDDDTAKRVARRFSRIVRAMGATVIVVVNRQSVIDSLAPDKLVIVSYGKAVVRKYGEGVQG